jgi:branched-chain amino acid transport system ATP-binding protein
MLKVENVTKRFEGLVANAGVDFTVNPGEVFAIIGPNGAGKTTLFNMISGFYHPTEGRIRLEETDISQCPPYKICSLGVARTFQTIRLFSQLTVLENVMIGTHPWSKANWIGAMFRLSASRKLEKRAKERAYRELEAVNLTHKALEMAGNLAYGDQRRVEIARAMASDPKVLLLDEPAAGMNIQESIELGEQVRALLARNVTILLIEHHMRVVMRVSHHIVVLDHGQKIAEGNPQEIQTNPAVIKAYLGDKAHAARN